MTGVERARLDRRRRIGDIRRRTFAIAAVVFALLWAGIFFQLVSGRDPALAKRKGTSATSAAPQNPSQSAPSANSGSASTVSPDTSGSGSTASTPTPAPVTTSQS